MKKEIVWGYIVTPRGSSDFNSLHQLRQNWDLLLAFVYRDLISVYKQTLLGPLWILIQPLIQTFLYAFIFGAVAKIEIGTIPTFIFYMTGVTFWSIFANNFTSISEILIENENLFSKIYFPRTVMVYAKALSTLIKFLAQLMVLAIMLLVYYRVSLSLLDISLLIGCALLLTLISIGVGLLYASLNIKYKDFKQVSGVVVQVALFTSAVVYPISAAPQSIRDFLAWNPLTHIFQSIRYAMFDTEPVQSSFLIFSATCSILIFIFGILLFQRVVHRFVDTI